MSREIRRRIQENIKMHQQLLQAAHTLQQIDALAAAIADVFAGGGKILLCGNGGSAMQAQHIAGELLGRFQKERAPWAALALHTDTAVMTALANDYGYANVYARQVAGHMRAGDLLIGLSTSGCSENICRAMHTARSLNAATAAWTGQDGGRLQAMADYHIAIPSTVTARIQEGHMLVGHILCERIEAYV